MHDRKTFWFVPESISTRFWTLIHLNKYYDTNTLDLPAEE